MYVSGSRSFFSEHPGRLDGDWLHNIKIPTVGVEKTPKYRAMVQMLSLYPHINHLVGHSLGAQAAYVYAKRNGLTYSVYNRPGISWTRDPNSHSHWGDWVSLGDRGAVRTVHGVPFADVLGAHSYRND